MKHHSPAAVLRFSTQSMTERSSPREVRRTKSQRLSLSNLLELSESLVNTHHLFPRLDVRAVAACNFAPPSPMAGSDVEEDLSIYFKQSPSPVKVTEEKNELSSDVFVSDTEDKKNGPTSVTCYGCHYGYSESASILVVNFEQKGQRYRDNVIAKVCLLPDRLQKQKIPLVTDEGLISTPRSAYFRGYSACQLKGMRIYVRIYRQRGVFRRLRLMHEWEVPLTGIDGGRTQVHWHKAVMSAAHTDSC